LNSIERINWLAHRWPIKKRTQPYGGWTLHIGEIERGSFKPAMRRSPML
jgi:hypothetical protein